MKRCYTAHSRSSLVLNSCDCMLQRRRDDDSALKLRVSCAAASALSQRHFWTCRSGPGARCSSSRSLSFRAVFPAFGSASSKAFNARRRSVLRNLSEASEHQTASSYEPERGCIPIRAPAACSPLLRFHHHHRQCQCSHRTPSRVNLVHLTLPPRRLLAPSLDDPPPHHGPQAFLSRSATFRIIHQASHQVGA